MASRKQLEELKKQARIYLLYPMIKARLQVVSGYGNPDAQDIMYKGR